MGLARPLTGPTATAPAHNASIYVVGQAPGHCGPVSRGGSTSPCYSFGAAASVWNLNRAADAVQILVPLGHFFDDFNGTLRMRPSPTSSPCSPRHQAHRCPWSRASTSQLVRTAAHREAPGLHLGSDRRGRALRPAFSGRGFAHGRAPCLLVPGYLWTYIRLGQDGSMDRLHRIHVTEVTTLQALLLSKPTPIEGAVEDAEDSGPQRS